MQGTNYYPQRPVRRNDIEESSLNERIYSYYNIPNKNKCNIGYIILLLREKRFRK